MPPKKIRTRAIESSKYVIYPKKAQDFYQTMQLALGEGNWDSAGLEAVHCAIFHRCHPRLLRRAQMCQPRSQ